MMLDATKGEAQRSVAEPARLPARGPGAGGHRGRSASVVQGLVALPPVGAEARWCTGRAQDRWPGASSLRCLCLEAGAVPSWLWLLPAEAWVPWGCPAPGSRSVLTRGLQRVEEGCASSERGAGPPWAPVKALGAPPRSLLEKELESVGIRLNKHKPNIYFKVRPLSPGSRARGLGAWRGPVSVSPLSPPAQERRRHLL